ncbi:MAG: hypothetical protein HQK96_01520 [Nitrospirae bacterium]|nr:hypothetical protein [Nitrospirota bacterium]
MEKLPDEVMADEQKVKQLWISDLGEDAKLFTQVELDKMWDDVKKEVNFFDFFRAGHIRPKKTKKEKKRLKAERKKQRRK